MQWLHRRLLTSTGSSSPCIVRQGQRKMSVGRPNFLVVWSVSWWLTTNSALFTAEPAAELAASSQPLDQTTTSVVDVGRQSGLNEETSSQETPVCEKL